MPLGKRM